MNKRTATILSLVFICIFFASCASRNSENNDTTTIIAQEIEAFADSNDGGMHVNECNQWTKDMCSPFESKSAQNSRSTEFNGQIYTGKYWYSLVELFNNYQTDYYLFDDGWFSINSSNGELSAIGFYDIKAGEKTIEDCQEQAISLAKQYIDISEYKLITQSNECVNTFTFQSYMNGCETCAKISVGISTCGDIVTFSQMMTDEFEYMVQKKNYVDIDRSIEKMTSEYCENVVQEKVASIYKDLRSNDVFNKVLVYLENGGIGMVYIVDVTLTDNTAAVDNQVDISTSRVCILVTEK